jgi:hypothetical protein
MVDVGAARQPRSPEAMRSLIRLLPLAALVALAVAPASATDFEQHRAPPAAQEFAATTLLEDLEHLLADPVEAADFGFERPIGTLGIGPLHPSYSPSEALYTGEDTPTLGARLAFRREWIAVVYQDGAPRNVVGVWEPTNGTYEMSTFGYGGGLAMALDGAGPQPADGPTPASQGQSDRQSPQGRRAWMYEAPISAWYEVDDALVIHRNGPPGSASPMTWETYGAQLRGRSGSAAAGGTMTGGATAPSNGANPALLAGSAAALVLLSALVTGRARRRDK